jgi:hypothetical protein
MRPTSRELFPTDAPVPYRRMIGRHRDVEALARDLAAGAHRIVAAPRRTGKSSVCEAAATLLAKRGFYTVQVNLFRAMDAAALAEAIAQQTLANRGALRRAIAGLREAGAAAAGAATMTLAARAQADLGDGVQIALVPGRAAREPAQALRSALELPQRIAERDGRRLVLFIDELQEIARPAAGFGEPESTMGFIRETLHRSDRVTALFAGSIEHMMRDLFSNRHRALYGFGGFAELSPILPRQWRKGLIARFAEDERTLQTSAADRLIDAGESHPRATMLIAQHTHICAVEREASHIDDAVVLEGIASALAAERARHLDTIDAIRRMGRSGAAAIRVVGNLATGQPAYHGLAPQAAKRAIDHLQNAGILSRPPGTHSGWEISDPLFARYIRTETTM